MYAKTCNWLHVIIHKQLRNVSLLLKMGIYIETKMETRSRSFSVIGKVIIGICAKYTC